MCKVPGVCGRAAALLLCHGHVEAAGWREGTVSAQGWEPRGGEENIATSAAAAALLFGSPFPPLLTQRLQKAPLELSGLKALLSGVLPGAFYTRDLDPVP